MTVILQPQLLKALALIWRLKRDRLVQRGSVRGAFFLLEWVERCVERALVAVGVSIGGCTAKGECAAGVVVSAESAGIGGVVVCAKSARGVACAKPTGVRAAAEERTARIRCTKASCCRLVLAEEPCLIVSACRVIYTVRYLLTTTAAVVVATKSARRVVRCAPEPSSKPSTCACIASKQTPSARGRR